MAEELQTPAPHTKRRLRTNTETVRERTAKIQSDAGKPRGRSVVRAFLAGFFSPLRVLGRYVGKLGRFRIFRLLGLILLPRYIRNSWRELRQVTWPSRRESRQLTSAVIIFSVLFGLIVAGVDFVLDKLFKELIIK